MTDDASPAVPSPPTTLRPDTLAVRGGLHRTAFDEMSEPLFLTQGYIYPNAANAEAAFAGEIERYQYSRYGNPTVTTFEERLALIEGADACFATATGMAAVFVSLASILRQGSRLVAARALFGSSLAVFNEYFAEWGIQVDYVDAHVNADWERALATPADAIYVESPTNPMQDVVDIPFVAALAKKAGALFIVDNVFATPVGQKPLELGADAVVYSATKHIDGQGRVLGGAVLGSSEYINGPVRTMVRTIGSTMSPFAAWVLAKSLETLSIRVKAMAASAVDLAAWLDAHPQVAVTRYPLLPSHPQYERAASQMTLGGTLVTIDIALPEDVDPHGDEAKAAAFRFMDALQVIDISNNLGDAKSIATHPATTTHRKLGVEGRAAVGMSAATVRLSIGLEDVEDLREDLARALEAV
ncbi:O-succinylhomoserine sulfhydrylase [Demequina sp. TTPB684]|uniref:O-succinylhomoserine sulfhydrylase n=1 Tax=unclassified Demequina TaxID=2620311 RepID=UPI001CF47397|nr:MULTISPECIES: O-succinylhomoserine sulfhydrylase [unclassified Demequina]MCB2411924.1 O-succinylhomoserine sulfhydrylase [Demequina sp. TTPB684]UPU87648.1 O-succinylhomoserine sulfhydrylase [Demequina sp. TMPB413]